MLTPGATTPPDEAWLTILSARHVAVSLSCAVLAAGLVLGARRARGTRFEAPVRRCFAWTMLALAIVYNTWWNWPGRFDIGESLPLQLCDLGMVLAPLALLTRRRLLRTLVVFWGLGLSTQAFIVPVEEAGPAQPVFWLFWLGHTQVIAAGLYEVGVAGYRPRRSDFVRALAGIVAYAAAMLVLNPLVGGNYLYIGPGDEQPGIVLALGPWPWRIGVMGALAALALAGVWVGAGMIPGGERAQPTSSESVTTGRERGETS
jgi:hypothetical integral membrane protein (TIGR02206 family)